MKPLVALLAAFVMSDADACERSLIGTWKSDGETTMTYTREHAKLQLKTVDFLGALVGRMTLAFDAKDVHLVMPDVDAPVSGRPRRMVGFEERKPYKVLFCSDAMIVWSAKRSFGDEEEATTFHFVDPDTFWIYTGTAVPGIPDMHLREYFKRIP